MLTAAITLGGIAIGSAAWSAWRDYQGSAGKVLDEEKGLYVQPTGVNERKETDECSDWEDNTMVPFPGDRRGRWS